LEEELAAKDKKLKDMDKQLAKALAAAEKAEKKQKDFEASSAKFKAKAALAESDDDSSQSGDDVGKVAPKMEAPRTKFDGNVSDWKGWHRTVMLWYNTRQKWASDRTLGALLVESLEGEAQKLVYSYVKEGGEKFRKIMDVLKGEYELDAQLRMVDAVQALRQFRRTGGSTLHKHLQDYHALLLDAIKEGLTPSATDGVDLLSSCDLPPQTHTNVLIQLGASGKDDGAMTYTQVRTVLRTIAKAEELKSRERQQRSEAEPRKDRKRSASDVLVGDSSQPAKKKREFKGQAKGKGKGPRAASGKGRSDQLCPFFAQGRCRFGDQCFQSHAQPALFGAKGAKGQFLAGDWECPTCKTHNFAKNESCFNKECGTKRPQGKGSGKGGKGAGGKGAGGKGPK